MTRQRLPHRRHCETWSFFFEKIRCVISYGRTNDGRIREVFIDAGKTGTLFESLTCDASTLASIALQHGATPEELAHSLIRNPDGSPASPIGVVLDDMVMG
jgi:hypothetical protein